MVDAAFGSGVLGHRELISSPENAVPCFPDPTPSLCGTVYDPYMGLPSCGVKLDAIKIRTVWFTRVVYIPGAFCTTFLLNCMIPVDASKE